MAMEAVVLQRDWFGYNSKDVSLGGNWSYGFELGKEEENFCSEHFPGNQTSDTNNQVDGDHWDSFSMAPPLPHSSGPSAMGRRKKRRSTKAPKNKEEMENQRMTHITVERNRRKQMNQYLSIIRSLMPPSYVQRVCCVCFSFNHCNRIHYIQLRCERFVFCIGGSSINPRGSYQFCKRARAKASMAKWSERGKRRKTQI